MKRHNPGNKVTLYRDKMYVNIYVCYAAWCCVAIKNCQCVTCMRECSWILKHRHCEMCNPEVKLQFYGKQKWSEKHKDIRSCHLKLGDCKADSLR